MVYNYRISKYSPEKRDKDRTYLGDEWTSFSDVGKAFDGKIFTKEEYYQIEDIYVSVALSFLIGAGIDKLTLTYLEKCRLSRTRVKASNGNRLYPSRSGTI